eukprot:CAMPEP_0174247164 /NCGR_PEP_ID=MMETSP0417-20130205/42436_1 /TAXON_ID=242541 /ORGANISM="Mayorella sp, Strain BSH-02190019" /LENGTH=380 /DNA_ID=CAMNT_0015327019 /DNA_START=671 /DNA_END=1816 /DNA_ORIENTATION=+
MTTTTDSSMRLDWLLSHLVSQKVVVQLADKRHFRGLLHKTSTIDGLGVVLKYASQVDPANLDATLLQRPKPTVTFPASEVVQVIAFDIKLEGGAQFKERDFRTDTDITKRGGSEVGERTLTPWQPDASDTWNGTALEDEKLDSSWDQFAVNREKFGIQSSYHEDYYTTSLKPSEISSAQVAKAEKLAKEIMRKKTSNPHLAEERGHKLQSDADMDEEDRYSGVLRSDGKPSGKYVIPSQRKPATSKKPNQTKPTPAETESKPNTVDETAEANTTPTEPTATTQAPEPAEKTPEKVESSGGMSMSAMGMRADAPDFNPLELGFDMDPEPVPVPMMAPAYPHPHQMMHPYGGPPMNPNYPYMQPTYPPATYGIPPGAYAPYQ